MFSVVLAGGGIKKGYIYGTSERHRPPSRTTTRSTVEDLATTVYHQLGIDADKKLMAPGNRPDRDRATAARSVKELLGLNCVITPQHRFARTGHPAVTGQRPDPTPTESDAANAT